MQFFVFRAHAGEVALASDKSGAGLPAAMAPWTYIRVLELDEGIDPPSGFKVVEALQLLDRDGYYLVPPTVEMEEGDPDGIGP